MCKWHWSDADQSVAWTDSDSPMLFYVSVESDNNNSALKDIYYDITVRGWGKPGDSYEASKPLAAIVDKHAVEHWPELKRGGAV